MSQVVEYPTVDAALRAFLSKQGFVVRAPTTFEGQKSAAEQGFDAVRVVSPFSGQEVGLFPSEHALRMRLRAAVVEGRPWSGLNVYRQHLEPGQVEPRFLGVVAGDHWREVLE